MLPRLWLLVLQRCQLLSALLLQQRQLRRAEVLLLALGTWH
jgi:hypothetical protein